MTKQRWALLAGAVVVLAVGLVLGARALVGTPAVAAFIERYPGVASSPDGMPVGTPVWLGVQHFLNVFFIVMMIRTGLLIRYTRKPKAYWTRDNSKLVRTKGKPSKISFNLWIHLWCDVLWFINGVIFVIALLASGHWMKVVPTSWDVIPNAASVALQYLSLNWPTENGWIHYNALQLLFYFVTIFIAAPLSALTGFRISPAFSKRWTGAARLLPIEVARKIHFVNMVYFVIFISTHVFLVFATGALRNLNHMYAARDDAGWLGLALFGASLLLIAGAWVLARPIFLKPVAQLTGKVTAK